MSGRLGVAQRNPTGGREQDLPSQDVSAPGKRRVGLGFLDVAGSSLASFSLGIFATRYLPSEQLGLYALFFTGFLLGAVVPAQQLCVPAEIAMVHDGAAAQFRNVRHTVGWIAGAGTLTALVAASMIAVGVGAGTPGYAAMALTMVPASALSPFQDHLRRLCHQANASTIAATMSLAQVFVTVSMLALIGMVEGQRSWAPFGALLAANVVSSALGLALVRRAGFALGGRVLPLRRLAQTGRWLTAAGVAQAAGGLGSLLIISALAGVAEAGYAEGARVVSQPIYVVATGLLAVMSPAIFRARHAQNLELEAQLHRRFKRLLALSSVILVLAVTRFNPLNPLPGLLPVAYRTPLLLECVVLAQFLFQWPLSTVASLLARDRAPEASRAQVAALPPQLVASASAGVLGAWAFFVAFLAAALSRLVAIGTVDRRGRSLRRRRSFRRSRLGEDSSMSTPHPIAEPSIVGAMRRRPAVVVCCLLVGLAGGVGAALVGRGGYEAAATITVEDPRVSSVFAAPANLEAKRYVADQVALLGSEEVRREVVAELQGAGYADIDEEAVEAKLTVTSSEASNTVTVAYRSDEEREAQAAVDAAIAVYTEIATETNRDVAEATSDALARQLADIDARLAALDAQIVLRQAQLSESATGRDPLLDAFLDERNAAVEERTELSVRQRSLAVDLARNPSGVTRRSATLADDAPSKALQVVLVGLVLGGTFGAALCYRLERRRSRFDDVAEPEALLGVRYLAALPASTVRPDLRAAQRRASVVDFLATVLEAESRRHDRHRFGLVSPSSSPELLSLAEDLRRSLVRGRATSSAVGSAGYDERHLSVAAGLRAAVPAEPRRTILPTQIVAIEANGAPTLLPARPTRNGNGNGNGNGAANGNGNGATNGNGAANGNGRRPADPRPAVDDEPHPAADAAPGSVRLGRRPVPPEGVETPDALRQRAVGPAPMEGDRPGAATIEERFASDQPESLVLIDLREGATPAGGESAEVDAIVLVLDRSENIAAATEVVHRANVLGWPVLGYVYITDAGPT